jgi:hypothetical protein
MQPRGLVDEQAGSLNARGHVRNHERHRLHAAMARRVDERHRQHDGGPQWTRGTDNVQGNSDSTAHLVLRDGLAHRLALQRVPDGLVHRTSCEADGTRAYTRAREVERLHRNLEAVPNVT